MIKENEIRIGNWFHHNSNWSYRSNPELEPFTFQWNDRDWYAVGECTMSLCNVRPIHLTPEVLKSAGFEYSEEIEGYTFKANNIYRMMGDGEVWWEYHPFGIVNINLRIEIEFLHQLQNLYFALIGEELKIEL